MAKRPLRLAAQSAMEYLMTYGWAILIIAVVLAALFELGVFNGSNLAPQACIAQSGFVCKNPIYTANGITFTFGQTNGRDYYGDWVLVAAEGKALDSNGVPANFLAGAVPIAPSNVLIPGQTVPVDFPSPDFQYGAIPSNPTIGTPFAGYVWLGYCLSPCTSPTAYSKVATITIKSAGGFSGPTSTSTTSTTTIGSYSITFQVTPSIAVAPGNVVMTVNGISITYAQLPYSTVGQTGQNIPYAFSSPIASTNAGTQYAFNAIAAGGCAGASGQSGSVTVSSVCTVTGNYVTQYQLAANVYPSIDGAVSFSQGSSGDYYDAGNTVTLTNNPNTNYVFYTWSGSVTSSSNPLAVTLAGPVTETANELPEYVAEFPALNSYVDVAPINTGSSGVTMTAWVYLRGGPTYPSYNCETGILSNFANNGGEGVQINAYTCQPGFGYIQSCCNSYYLAPFPPGTQSLSSPYSGHILPIHEWLFVAVTYDRSAGVAVSYLNNGEVSAAISSGLQFSSSSNLYIGANGWETTENLNGSVADAQVYDTALSPNQVQTIYQEGIGGAPLNGAGIVGWWPLNGNANDYSGNGNNGNAYSVTWDNTWQSGYAPP